MHSAQCLALQSISQLCKLDTCCQVGKPVEASKQMHQVLVKPKIKQVSATQKHNKTHLDISVDLLYRCQLTPIRPCWQSAGSSCPAIGTMQQQVLNIHVMSVTARTRYTGSILRVTNYGSRLLQLWCWAQKPKTTRLVRISRCCRS